MGNTIEIRRFKHDLMGKINLLHDCRYGNTAGAISFNLGLILDFSLMSSDLVTFQTPSIHHDLLVSTLINTTQIVHHTSQ